MAKTGGGRLLQGGRALLLKQMGRGAEACAIVAALLSKAQHNPTSAQLHNPTLAAHFASIAAMASYHQTRKAIIAAPWAGAATTPRSLDLSSKHWKPTGCGLKINRPVRGL